MSRSSAADHSAARPVALRMRADLSLVRRAARGGYRWLVKDPISLRYFELTDEEHAVLTMLDGRATLAQLKESIERRFPPRIATYEQLHALVHRFFELGLIFGDGAAQTPAARKAARSQRQNRWFGLIINPLYIQLPGIDPEPFLRRLDPKVRWLFGRIPLATALVFIAAAAVVLAMNFDRFASELPSVGELFQAGNFVWLMIALAGSKALHELGHAVTCKHFGGECHEIGVALLMFTPSLYCDTTDIWLIPGKWQRAAVGAAGMAVELVLAAACIIVWRFSEPGIIHFLCLNTVIVCTVSTLVFNGNPLLKFDGYYILSDLLEIPNLAQKSRDALLQSLRTQVLGLPDRTTTNSAHNRVFLLSYAVAALVYRWMIAFGIVLLLSKALRPYGLQAVGNLLLGLTLMGMVVLPGWRMLRYASRPGTWRQVRWVRASVWCALAILLVGGLLYLPIPHRILAPFVLEHRSAERVYVTVPGTLEAVHAQAGDPVVAGAPIVTLTNAEVVREISRLTGERDRLQLHLQNLSRRQGHDRDAADAIPAARTALADMEERLRRRQLDEQRLQLAAHQDGVLMPPPHWPAPPQSDEELPTWSGQPLEPQNRGSFLEVGTLVGLVGDPAAMDALLIIDQSDIEFVRPGQSVEIKLNEYRGSTLRGEIVQVAQIDLQQVPRVLSHKSGGELSTVTDESGSERPVGVAYQARVPLVAVDHPLLPGFHGRAIVDVGSEPLGGRIVRFIRHTFLF